MLLFRTHLVVAMLKGKTQRNFLEKHTNAEVTCFQLFKAAVNNTLIKLIQTSAKSKSEELANKVPVKFVSPIQL